MSNINSSEIELKHFLKADPYNEEYIVIRHDKESINTKLINGNKEFFNSVILQYHEQPSEKHYIVLLNENNKKIYSEQIQEWIDRNIYNAINDTLVFIEGYAGCGKTTWVQSIIYNTNTEYYKYIYDSCDISDSFKEVHKDHYINLYDSFSPGKHYSKEVIRYNIINSIILRMTYVLKENSKERREQILNDFCDLLSDLSIQSLSNRLPNISKPFQKDLFKKGKREDTFFYKYAKRVKNSQNSEKNFVDILRQNINEKNMNSGEYVFSTFDILCFDYLWRIAVNNNTRFKANNLYVCYDNLDIIDDMEALAEFINDLESLKTNIKRFREDYIGELIIPFVVIFATCRKITSAKLQVSGLSLPSERLFLKSFNSNEAAERDSNRASVIKIELSHLYNYERMMKKRANYFRDKLSNLVDFNDVARLNNCIKMALKLPNTIFSELNYAGLWNNNHRACSNVLNKILTNYQQYYDAFVCDYNSLPDANGSILLHIIIKVLNERGEWVKSLGYKDNKITTVSRLILTFLHNKKQIGENVSILQILNTFCRVVFDDDSEQQDEVLCIKYICNTMQNMLTRLPNDKEEIWRRPIFYKSNALTCNNRSIGTKLYEQYNDADENKCTVFSISDEGSTFIDKIVPTFEFYSARTNSDSQPLFCITNKEQLKSIINVVFTKVESCCNRQVIFMGRYMSAYDIKTIEEYLILDFHPITSKGYKQLHIIRVIFSHISFFNSFRDYLYKYDSDRFAKFNKTLIFYIKEYLKLYEKHFYNIMDNKVGRYNNKVWNDLVLKCNNAIGALKNYSTDLYVNSITREESNEEDEIFQKMTLIEFEMMDS